MKKKTIIVLAAMLVLLATTIITVCIINNNAAIAEEERQHMIRLTQKTRFGNHMRFDFRVVTGDRIFSSGEVALTYIHTARQSSNPLHTDVIFVHTKAESLNFPDDIIVAWPRTIEETGEIDVEFYNALIDGIHWMASRTEEQLTRTRVPFEGQVIRQTVTLEEFGLTYPITIEDLVDNWEKVEALWLSFNGDERSRLLGGARTGNLSYRERVH